MAVLIYHLLPKDIKELTLRKFTIKNKLKDFIRNITIKFQKIKMQFNIFQI